MDIPEKKERFVSDKYCIFLLKHNYLQSILINEESLLDSIVPNYVNIQKF